MKKLINSIERLKRSPVKKLIENRIKEFETVGESHHDKIFDELCFCLMTANFSAQRSIDIQNKIGKGFHNLSRDGLSKRLRELGHRFPNMRAKFIVEARKHKKTLLQFLKEKLHDHHFREWLVKNVKGLGYKEASHFLRNIGRKECAIIDFHIIDLLARHGLIKKAKPISKKMYFDTEKTLRMISEKTGSDLSELDLYLWHLETGKILK